MVEAPRKEQIIDVGYIEQVVMNVVVDSNRDIKDGLGYESGSSILSHTYYKLLICVRKLLNLLSQ